MSKPLPLIALASMLTACASGPPPTPTTGRSPPPHLVIPCPALPAPASGRAGDLLANHVMTMRAYHTCLDRHKTLSEWARNDAR
ncbi:MAG: Rz1-like lysis system protein LysC [Pseudomonadota bacterium]